VQNSSPLSAADQFIFNIPIIHPPLSKTGNYSNYLTINIHKQSGQAMKAMKSKVYQTLEL